jgi:hypothetical protein
MRYQESGPAASKYPESRAADDIGFPQLACQFTLLPGNAVLLHLGRGDLVNADAPLFARTATHAGHRTSLRLTLLHSAWNLRPGSALASRTALVQGTDRIGRETRHEPRAARVAETALTGPAKTDTAH